MDEVIGRLRDQEQALHATIEVFSRAAQRTTDLGGGVGWVGPASAAYDVAVFTLHAELRVAEDHLAAALAGTVNALAASARTGQPYG